MKKILAILGMITCMIGLAACGSKEEDPRTPMLIQSGEGTVDALYDMIQQGTESYYSADPTYDGILEFKELLATEIGDYQGTNGGEVVYGDDSVIISVNVLGSKHNAVVELTVDSNTATLSSVKTNLIYTFGELMQQAALNTLIGMGTVFVVLILISLIIASFGLIAKVQKKAESKAKANAETAPKAAPVVEQIAEREELSDDTELAAVIAAAIAAYEGAGSTDGFVVRSIRKSNKSKWQNA